MTYIPQATSQAARRVGRPVGASATRERLLEVAEGLFSERGLAGTTVRDVAEQLGVSGAALLHHFGTKETLYAEVLERVAASLQAYAPPPGTSADTAKLNSIFERHLDWTLAHPNYSRLIMRELLENRSRAGRAHRWYLKPVMGAYIDAIERGQTDSKLPAFDAEIFAYLVTGAIAHFAAAAFSVTQMHGLRGEAEALERFRSLLRALLDAAMSGLAPRAAPPRKASKPKKKPVPRKQRRDRDQV